jgi:hypothetical protein
MFILHSGALLDHSSIWEVGNLRVKTEYRRKSGDERNVTIIDKKN